MTLALSALQTATQVSARGLLRYAGSMLGPRPWGQAFVSPAGPEGPFAARTSGLLQAQAHQLSAR